MKSYFTRLSTFSTFSTFIFITESNKRKNIKEEQKREWGAVAWSIYRLNIGR